MRTAASSALGELKTLWHLTFHPIRGARHADRLESFYGGQAERYDSFRERLLQGRREMMTSIDVPRDAVWVDLGAGTGANAEFLAPRINQIRKLYLVDLCPSLLEVARRRIEARKWDQVDAVCDDATSYQPPERPVDVVTFSYSLTMIPDWFRAIEHARTLLKPGGMIGVVDFYVSRKYPEAGLRHHSWMTRNAWPLWFGLDNVYLSPDHLPFLQSRFDTVRLDERQARVPYVPIARVPYYCFVGRKSAGD